MSQRVGDRKKCAEMKGRRERRWKDRIYPVIKAGLTARKTITVMFGIGAVSLHDALPPLAWLVRLYRTVLAPPSYGASDRISFSALLIIKKNSGGNLRCRASCAQGFQAAEAAVVTKGHQRIKLILCQALGNRAISGIVDIQFKPLQVRYQQIARLRLRDRLTLFHVRAVMPPANGPVFFCADRLVRFQAAALKLFNQGQSRHSGGAFGRGRRRRGGLFDPDADIML